ncbi:hypothetical protein GYMLUDRAFT_253574 [Collybiopsis luxurians FD-317 M1]|uniref:DUF6532 domain-containing protein n=1 Tax=Collybiopsis luxurians FD-317 M1 TaxID=944289 RepID=A0A0D0B6S7_9AGAR|nr:hypothetical protein GYMLUDRAFT_253574 [Collybiopsis luxurians FD-317 M1]
MSSKKNQQAFPASFSFNNVFKRAPPDSTSHAAAKRSKTNSQEVLNPFTANANGGQRKSTRAPDSSKTKVRSVQLSGKKDIDVSSYMSTLLKAAPGAENLDPKAEGHGRGLESARSSYSCLDNGSFTDPIVDAHRLNSAEQEFLDDVNSEGAVDKAKANLSEEAGGQEEEEGSNGAGDAGQDGQDEDRKDDNMTVEDVTPHAGPKKVKSNLSNKVLLSEFADPKLALFAKRCARAATCIINMCPEDPSFCMPVFLEEMDRLRAEGRAEQLLESLAKIDKDPDTRDPIVAKMCYGTSAVRHDVGREARIRTGQFFDIPGSLSQSETISVVNWLLKDRRYHNGEVDVVKRTSNNRPFRSPLLGLLLRGYLVQGKPKQDRLLLSKLQRDERIPLPFIAMCTVLIGHSLQEFSSGYKVENEFSASNLASHYRAVVSTLNTLQQNAPAYVDLLQSDLYEQMMTAGPEVVPPQSYDYDALNAFALQRNDNEVDEQGDAEQASIDSQPVPDMDKEEEVNVGDQSDAGGGAAD